MAEEKIYRIAIQGGDTVEGKLAKVTAQLKKTNEERNRLNKLLAQNGKLSAAEGAKLTSLTRKTQALTVQKRELTKQYKLQNGLMKKSGGLAGALTKGFGMLTAQIGGAYAAFRLFTSSIKKIVDFELAMAKVNAVSGATKEEFKLLRENAISLGGATKFTASEVAGLENEYAKLGFTATEILDSTAAATKLATLADEDLSEAAAVSGATLRGFNLDAKESNRIVDVMAKSFTSSALDLNRFGESMKYVAPIAANLGIPIEEVTAQLSALADAGIHGSMAGTSLRKIYQELGRSGGTMDDLARSGISVKDSFDEVGARAQTSLLVLSKNKDKVKELTTAYNNATGSATEMAAIIEDTASGAFDRLASAWEKLIIKMSGEDGGSSMAALLAPAQALLTLLADGKWVIEDMADAGETFTHKFTGVNDGVEKSNELFLNMGAMLKSQLETLPQYSEEWKKLNAVLDEITGPDGPNIPAWMDEINNKITEGDEIKNYELLNDEERQSIRFGLWESEASKRQEMHDNTISLIENQLEADLDADIKRMASRKVVDDIEKKLADLEDQRTQAKINNAFTYVEALINVFGISSKLGKAFFAIQQTMAIAEIWVNLAKTKMANVAATAYLNIVPGAGAAAAAILNGIATGQAIANTALIAGQTVGALKQFADGGIIGGRPHSQGGTTFTGSDGSQFEAERGEFLAVVNRRDAATAEAYSQINSKHGNSYFADGGIVMPEASTQDGQLSAMNAMRNELKDLRVYVVESDISNMQKHVQVVENEGDF